MSGRHRSRSEQCGVLAQAEPDASDPLSPSSARPSALWLVGGSVDALGGIVRYLHANGAHTDRSDLAHFWVAVPSVATAGTIFCPSCAQDGVPNSVKAVELASDLRSYGGGGAPSPMEALALGMRALFTILFRESSILSEGRRTRPSCSQPIGAAIAGVSGLWRERSRPQNEPTRRPLTPLLSQVLRLEAARPRGSCSVKRS